MPATCGRREFARGLSSWVATVPKHDRTAAENEDAAAWCLGTRRFAISDGATDAAFSARWAAALAREWVAAGPSPGHDDLATALPRWLPELQQEWREGIPWERLPWYAEEKARAGAFATLLALEIAPFDPPVASPITDGESPLESTGWRAFAVGDSCLLHWRQGQLLTAFPLVHSRDFGTRPYLIGSQPDCNPELSVHCRVRSGSCLPGDHFLLATDALAQWLFREMEEGRWRLGELLLHEEASAFARLVEGWRAAEGLRNDDTTLLHVQVGLDLTGSGVAGSLPAGRPVETPPLSTRP